MSVKLLIELNLVFLGLTGGCTGSSESTLVKMAHCWKSHVTVQIFLNTGPRVQSVTCLATDACLTADPGVLSLIPARYVKMSVRRLLADHRHTKSNQHGIDVWLLKIQWRNIK